MSFKLLFKDLNILKISFLEFVVNWNWVNGIPVKTEACKSNRKGQTFDVSVDWDNASASKLIQEELILFFYPFYIIHKNNTYKTNENINTKKSTIIHFHKWYSNIGEIFIHLCQVLTL